MTNNTSNALFVDDLTELIKNRIPNKPNTIILGNFNVHTDNLEDNNAIPFNSTMEGMGLEQHIFGPTHNLGNTFDLISTEIMS